MRQLIVAIALLVGSSAVSQAQVIPQRPPAQQRQPEDTVKVPKFRSEPPISPLGAALRSLLLPGWGQSVLGRRVTGAAFVVWEGLTLWMTVKSSHQLAYQKSTGAETIDDKRQEVQDWAVLLAFNHLLSAAEAFVAANLWDFPADLELHSLPQGVGAGLSVRF